MLILFYQCNSSLFPANAALILQQTKDTLELKVAKEWVLSHLPDDLSLVQPDSLAVKVGLYTAGLIAGCTLVCCIQCCFVAVYYIKPARNCATKLRNKVLWNMFIKVFQGGYLTYIFSSMVYVVTYDYTKFFNLFEYVASLMILVVCVCLGIAQHQFVMDTKHKALDSMKNRYGSIYAGIDTKRQEALKQVGLFYLTRTLAAAFLAFNNLESFLHAMWLVWLFGVCIAFTWRVKPHYLTGKDTSWNQHKIEMLNYVAFYYLIMATLLFTEYVREAELQYTIGWLYVAALAITVCVILMNLVYSILFKVIRKRFVRRRVQRQRKRE